MCGPKCSLVAGQALAPLASWGRERESDVLQELLEYSSDKAYGRKGTAFGNRFLCHGSLMGLHGGREWTRCAVVLGLGGHRALGTGRGMSAENLPELWPLHKVQYQALWVVLLWKVQNAASWGCGRGCREQAGASGW